MVEFAREHDVLLVHDFAYADLGFDGYEPPSILQVPGRQGRRGRALHAHEVVLDGRAGASGSSLGNAEVVAALAKLKSYLDYGTFQPIQIAAIVAMNEAPDYPQEVNEIYRGRRDALVDGLARIGWEIEKPKGTMFVWAPIPEPYEEMGSLEFAKMLRAGGQGRGLARRRASVPAARASCASRSSRTSSASARPCAASASAPHQARLTPVADQVPTRPVEAERDRGVGDAVDGLVALEEVGPGRAASITPIDRVGEHLGVVVGDAALDDRRP